MKEYDYTITCLKCGTVLLKTSVTNSQIRCPKCRRFFDIRLMDGLIRIQEIGEKAKSKAEVS